MLNATDGQVFFGTKLNHDVEII